MLSSERPYLHFGLHKLLLGLLQVSLELFRRLLYQHHTRLCRLPIQDLVVQLFLCVTA